MSCLIRRPTGALQENVQYTEVNMRFLYFYELPSKNKILKCFHAFRLWLYIFIFNISIYIQQDGDRDFTSHFCANVIDSLVGCCG